MTPFAALILLLVGGWHLPHHPAPAPAPTAPAVTTTTEPPRAPVHPAAPPTSTTAPATTLPPATTTTATPAPTTTAHPPVAPLPSPANPHHEYLGTDTAGYCTAATAYEAAHAKPGTVVVCPGALPAGSVATTYYTPGAPIKIVFTTRACYTAWRNEASNSYLDFAATNFAQYATSGVDPLGRRIDPYGECD